MTISIGTVAQQALRRLGVRIVPLDDSPTLTEMVPVADIATAALVELGVLNSDGIPATETVPQATIATSALIELGVIASDETPIASDQALTFDKVSSVHGSLVAQGIATWTLSTIPRAFTEEYTKLTAAMAGSSFGKAIDPAIVALLEGRIRAGATVLSADMPFMLDKVASVHAALDAQGVVWWTGDAVPRAFAMEYTKLTVANAGVSLGKAIDPAIIPALEARVRKGAMVLSADDNAQQAVQAVHDDLVMRGIARWGSLDIPTALGDPYVVLTSANLDPLFGLQTTDANDVRDAMVAIYRYIALPSSGETVSVAYF
jgi:hypothetical protein